MICGAISDTLFGRERCKEDSDHRGPHWRNTEPISCECKYFCRCER